MMTSFKNYFLSAVFIISISGCKTAKTATNQVNIIEAPTLIEQEAEPISLELKQKLWEQGVGFYARGNEPSWSLNMDFEGAFRFNTLDGINISAPSVEGSEDSLTGTTTFKTKTGSGDLIIQITKSDCRDNMSGEPFPYTVEVSARLTGEKDYNMFSGCGRHVPDPGLNNTWVVTAIRGVKLEEGKLLKGLPVIDLSINSFRLSGHDGCNHINGEFSTRGNTIIFGNLASTKMYCADMGMAEELGVLLSGHMYEYRFGDDHLMFIQDRRVVISLEKKR